MKKWILGTLALLSALGLSGFFFVVPAMVDADLNRTLQSGPVRCVGQSGSFAQNPVCGRPAR